MRKTAKDRGFLLCFIINMLFRGEWAAIAFLLLILHYAIDLPLFLTFIALGIWVIYSLIVTLIFSFANSSNTPTPYRENKNPYSKTNDDIFHK